MVPLTGTAGDHHRHTGHAAFASVEPRLCQRAGERRKVPGCLESTNGNFTRLFFPSARFNGFLVGLETAVQFLNEQMPRPPQDRQRVIAFQDLKKILDGGGQVSAIQSWIESYFG